MSEFVPVEGKSGLYRDSDSTAIVNRDKKSYLAYMQRKKVMENIVLLMLEQIDKTAMFVLSHLFNLQY